MTGLHPQDDLPGLLLGELPPATAVAVDQHLAGCDPCRRDLAAVAVAASALRDASRLPVAAAPDLPPCGCLPPAPCRWPARPAAPDALAARGGGRPGGPPARGRRADLRPRPRRRAGPDVALGAPAAGGATAEARMRGDGDDQIMTMTARGLPRPPAGA